LAGNVIRSWSVIAQSCKVLVAMRRCGRQECIIRQDEGARIVTIEPSNLLSIASLQRELVERVHRAAPHDGVHDTRVPGLAAIRAREPSQTLPSVYEPSRCIVVQGRKQARLVHEIYGY
jgi:hypothetical protein